jgi:hypothetical protein
MKNEHSLSGIHDFDFIIGSWNIRNRRRTNALDRDQEDIWEEFEARKTEAKHLDGKVIIDHFEGGAGLFYESTELPDGQPLQIRFTWDEITADSARWQQAFSFDGGKNWDTNWIMEITRQR